MCGLTLYSCISWIVLVDACVSVVCMCVFPQSLSGFSVSCDSFVRELCPERGVRLSACGRVYYVVSAHSHAGALVSF